MKGSRNTLNETSAYLGKRHWNFITELARNCKPGPKCIATMFDSFLRSGSVRTTTRKIGESDGISASIPEAVRMTAAIEQLLEIRPSRANASIDIKAITPGSGVIAWAAHGGHVQRRPGNTDPGFV